MKSYLSFIFLCSILIFTNCSDDNAQEEEPPDMLSGTLVVEGLTFEIEHGEILRFDELEANVAYGCPMYLLSSEFVLSDTEVQGTGHVIELWMATETSNYLKSGTYTYYNEEDPKVSSFVFGLFFNWKMENWEVDAYYQGISGTINVKKTGDLYELTIDVLADKYNIGFAGIDPEGEPIAKNVKISCIYKGDLKQKYFE